MASFANNGKLKLLIIVGTRPEIIRLSAVITKCRKYFDTLPLSVQFKDGTTLDLGNSGGGISPKGGKTYCEKSALFEEILDLDQVESITVADITVPLS